MGASLHWRIVYPHEHTLQVGLRSRFVAAMTEAFGNYPWRLTTRSSDVIAGMRAAWDGQDQQAFDEILEAIQQHQEIEVWPEY